MNKIEKKSMTVKGKLTMFAIIIEAVLIVISVTGVFVATLVNNARAERYQIYGEGQIAIVNAMSSFNRIRVQMRNALYVYDGETDKENRDDAIKQMKSFADEMNGYLNSFNKNRDSYAAETNSTYDECMTSMTDFENSLDKIYKYVNDGDIAAAQQEMLTVCNPASNIVNDHVQKIINLMDTNSTKKNEEINKEVKLLIAAIIVVCVIGALMTLMYSVNLIKSITIPVQQLSVAARKLGVGDINIELHKITNDDLGQLMDDFEEMAAAIREQSTVAGEIADGDMTVDVQPRSAEDILGKALNKLAHDTDNILGNVRESTMQVTVGADEVAAASQALAQGATEQASALEQVTASMGEIAERTKQNASQANEANDRVVSVKDMAVSGNDQMKALIGAMNDINESSETISKIIKTIDDIAFQTNILALNAAVEAARAGVHGKGFAVVAEEVRNLAAKSASAASETAEMIEDTIRKVNNGSQLAESTAKSLDEIVISIDKIVDLIGAIASASNEQATSVNQVDQAIEQVSQVVQTNSATSQECAASSAELSTQAANLRALVAHFKLTSSAGDSHGGAMPMDSIGGKSEPTISLDGEFGKY